MLHWLYSKGRGVFLEPDLGGKSGSPGGSPNGGADLQVEDPFKDIPFDELDDKTAALLKKAQAGFQSGLATLQTKSTEMAETVSSLKRQSSEFQSQRDTLDRKLKAIVGGETPPTTEDEYLQKAKEALTASGFSAADVEKQAPIYANLLKSQLGVLKKEIGKDLGGVVSAVVLQEAQSAFTTAQDQDEQGLMGVPEVAQKVWEQVQEMAKQGQGVNPLLVLNLAKIQYMDHAAELTKAGKPLPELQSRVPAGGNGVTPPTFTFPGASRTGTRPIVSPSTDPNGPKTPLNEDTSAALAATFNVLGNETGVRPKAFPKPERTRKV